MKKFRAFIRSYIGELSLMTLSLILLTGFIRSVTGIHYDEAHIFFRAQGIVEGARPLHGMTSYAGPVHQYLMALMFSLFGFKIEVLRLVSAFFNTLGLLITAALLKQLFAHDRTYIWAGLLIVTSPMFVTVSRYAGDVQCLNIFLSSTALYLLARSVGATRKKQALLCLGAGFFSGFLIYNHIIGVAFPASIALSSLLVFKRKAINFNILLNTSIGLVAGFGIRLYQFLFQGLLGTWQSKAPTSSFADTALDVLNFPRFFSQVLDGDILYRLFTGQNSVPVMPYFSIFFLVLIISRLVLHKAYPLTSLEKCSLLIVLLLCGSTIALTPDFTPHYFILPAFYGYVLSVIWVHPFLTATNSRTRCFSRIALGLILALNLGYLGSNYFHSYLQSGGRVSIFSNGRRQLLSSNAWIDVEKLYGQLVEKQVVNVVGDLSIVAPMIVHDLEPEKLKLFDKREAGHPMLRHNKAAFVIHNGPNFWNAKAMANIPPQVLRIGRANFVRDQSYDQNFRVYVLE